MIGVNSYGFGGSNAFILLQQDVIANAKEEHQLLSVANNTRAVVQCLPISSHFAEGCRKT